MNATSNLLNMAGVSEQMLAKAVEVFDLDLLSATSVYIARKHCLNEALAQLEDAHLKQAAFLETDALRTDVDSFQAAVLFAASGRNDVQAARTEVLGALAELQRASSLFTPWCVDEGDAVWDVDELAGKANCTKDETEGRTRLAAALETQQKAVTEQELILNGCSQQCGSIDDVVSAGETSSLPSESAEIDLDDVDALAAQGISFMDKSFYHLEENDLRLIWQEATLDGILGNENDDAAWDLDDLMGVVDNLSPKAVASGRDPVLCQEKANQSKGLPKDNVGMDRSRRERSPRGTKVAKLERFLEKLGWQKAQPNVVDVKVVEVIEPSSYFTI